MALLLEVPVAAEDVDVVSGDLWAAGAVAIEEVPGEAGVVVLRTCPAGPDGLDALLAAAGDRPGVRTTEVAADAGADAWRAHARPWRAGARLVVWPRWVDRDGEHAHLLAEGDVVVVLDPGRAFGSGAHTSTRLALAGLEAHVGPGSRVLDVGCGSGVLALAAAQLGAERVVAVDLDPVARAVTADNAAHAGLDDRVEVVADPVGDVAGTFDVVVANLLPDALRSVGPDLARRAAPDGHVVVAGLLDHQVQGVCAAMPTLGMVSRTGEDGWAGLVLRPLRP